METININYFQVIALEKAINEFAKEGYLFDTIKVINNGKGKPSFIEIEKTSTLDIFRLGMKTGFILATLE